MLLVSTLKYTSPRPLYLNASSHPVQGGAGRRRGAAARSVGRVPTTSEDNTSVRPRRRGDLQQSQCDTHSHIEWGPSRPAEIRDLSPQVR